MKTMFATPVVVQAGRVFAAASAVCTTMVLMVDPVHDAVMALPESGIGLDELLPYRFLSLLILTATMVWPGRLSTLSGSHLGAVLFLPFDHAERIYVGRSPDVPPHRDRLVESRIRPDHRAFVQGG